uniref:Nascent polypeptide-associated complex subunit beta n=1 Tax=Aegilops tauschii subsp. strangulata TaxID=200361 RepID=A0A453MIM0_AEGTS
SRSSPHPSPLPAQAPPPAGADAATHPLRQDEQGEAHEDGRRRPHRRQGHRAPEEEGGAQDGDHGRQAAAEHAQEGGRQHHPRHRGGQHLQGRPRHPVPQPQRVQASIAANTWVVSGTPQTKKLQDVLPSIINQLGPDNMEHLKRIAEEMQKQVAAAGAIQPKEENDDDVPELVPGETFEEVAQETKA